MMLNMHKCQVFCDLIPLKGGCWARNRHAVSRMPRRFGCRDSFGMHVFVIAWSHDSDEYSIFLPLLPVAGRVAGPLSDARSRARAASRLAELRPEHHVGAGGCANAAGAVQESQEPGGDPGATGLGVAPGR